MNSKRTRKRYNKNTKIIIIMVLMVGVIGLSIGFAAFSKNLDINSTATVTPDSSDFKVLFSSSENSVVDGDLKPSYVHNATGTTAKIDNSDPTHPKITGIKVTFTEPSNWLNYIFYVRNDGEYDAYLKNITFGQKTCTAKDGTSQALVNQVCEKIRLIFTINSDQPNKIDATKTMSVSNHPLKKGEVDCVTIFMDYFEIGATFADGDFDVEFGDLTLTYSTTDS